MPWHQKIKSYLMETGFNSLDVRVRGSSWGMACNSIHFIDLVCWLTGASIVSVEIDQLDNWIPAKRKGFYEVNGILSVRFSDFSSLVCECSHGDPSCQIEVKTPCGFLLIDESVGLASSSIGLEISGEVPYQSSLTTTLLTQLLDSGMCDLPSLEESVNQHYPFLKLCCDIEPFTIFRPSIYTYYLTYVTSNDLVDWFRINGSGLCSRA